MYLICTILIVLCISQSVVNAFNTFTPQLGRTSSCVLTRCYQTMPREDVSAPGAGGETETMPMGYRSASTSRMMRSITSPVTAAAVVAAIAATRPVSSVWADEAVAAPAAPAAPATPAAPAKVELGPAPTDFGLIQNDYYADAQKVVNHMRYSCQMEKGNPLLAEVAQKTKDEMGEFVSFYRRFNGISGKQSFSLLYTSINVLAGHYTSYGTKIAVPEKRRKRLLQEFNDIEKNIRKKR